MGTQKFVDDLGLVKQTASEISIVSRTNFQNENETEGIYFKLAFSEPVCSKKTKRFKTSEIYVKCNLQSWINNLLRSSFYKNNFSKNSGREGLTKNCFEAMNLVITVKSFELTNWQSNKTVSSVQRKKILNVRSRFRYSVLETIRVSHSRVATRLCVMMSGPITAEQSTLLAGIGWKPFGITLLKHWKLFQSSAYCIK